MKKKKKKIAWIDFVAPIILLTLIVFICELVARLGLVSKYILPAPSDVFINTVSKFSSDIWPHFILTLKVIIIGFVTASALGIILAAIISQSNIVIKAISPTIIWMIITPMITLVPLLTLWLGYDPMQRVFIVILQATPIITLNTLNGFTSLDIQKQELARAVGCSKFQKFTKLTFMNAMPQVFTGIKLGCINTTIAALSADSVSGNIGMGYKIKQYIKYNNIDLAYGSILLVALLGLILYYIVEFLEHKIVLWKN